MTIFPIASPELVGERKKRLTPLTKRASREDILNCFTPSQLIDTPARFVGREEAIKVAVSGLANSGMSLLVWGERGCGKSSLAFMIQQIATGNNELLEYYGLGDYLKRKGLLPAFRDQQRRRYKVIWVSSNKDMDIPTLCREILFRNRDDIRGPGLNSYVERLPDSEELSSEIGVDAPFKASAGGKVVYEREKAITPSEALRRGLERYAPKTARNFLSL